MAELLHTLLSPPPSPPPPPTHTYMFWMQLMCLPHKHTLQVERCWLMTRSNKHIELAKRSEDGAVSYPTYQLGSNDRQMSTRSTAGSSKNKPTNEVGGMEAGVWWVGGCVGRGKGLVAGGGAVQRRQHGSTVGSSKKKPTNEVGRRDGSWGCCWGRGLVGGGGERGGGGVGCLCARHEIAVEKKVVGIGSA